MKYALLPPAPLPRRPVPSVAALVAAGVRVGAARAAWERAVQAGVPVEYDPATDGPLGAWLARNLV